MLYGEDLIDWIAKHRPRVTAERQSDGPVTFPPPNDPRGRRITVVRAPMGSGKTTALIEWLLSVLRMPDMSALVVSCRRSFTRTLAGRFNDAGLVGFVTYFTSTDYIMRGKPFRRLLVQVESLHRVDPELIDGYDVVVLDEVMSTIGQLYSPTMRHLQRVDAVLARLLRIAPRVIAMDATANAQLVATLADLRGDENVHVIVGEYASPGFADRSCVMLRELGVDTLKRTVDPAENEAPADDSSSNGGEARSPRPQPKPNTFFAELGRRVAGGLNVCVFSSTVAFSETVARFCAAFTDSILVLNSTRTHEGDVASWGRYRVIIYTTVVTVGLSFDASHFHTMFAYVKPTVHGPDMVSVYQSLGRVRLLRLNEVFLYVDGSGARSEAVFTPMLLNHVVANGGGWPSKFSEVTNMLCCNFRRDCAPAFTDMGELYIFSRFKYKHLFERCTLNSLGDSINIIHSLLESNRITVTFAGCERGTDAKAFCALLRDLRRDAAMSQREMRALRKTDACAIPVEADVADSDEIAAFVQKYLKPSVSPRDVTELLRATAEPATRDNFINAVMLEACRRIPAAAYSEAVFRRVYDYYASGSVPIVTQTGSVESASLTRDLNVSARWDLYRLCLKISDAIGWDPSVGDHVYVEPDAVLSALRPDYEMYTRLLLEMSRCYVTDRETAAKRPVRDVKAALSGLGTRGGPVTEETHAVSLFRVLWGEIFGARLIKINKTFPGGTKVKNLRKHEIRAFLDEAGIDSSECHTHKQLYALLMANKAAFSKTRYKIRPPQWYKLLRSKADSEGPDYSHEAALEAALADVPSSSWPRVEGLVDFHGL
uniref:Replication origin-binding protein n=1 Tax=Anatid alphaherpesvirus 2 TaxID=3080522 RepID=A0AAU0K6L2_9ALPH